MSMNTMDYKGYTALVEYSAEDECLVGHIVGINDFLAFHGDSVAEAIRNFHDVLDNYLNACRRQGRKPQRPRSGKLLLRLPPELHARVAQRSEATGVSLNQWVVDTLETVCADVAAHATPHS